MCAPSRQASNRQTELLDECARADELVFGKLRERLGLGETNMLYAGAAPMPVDVLEFFYALGLPICELWGMSELTCVGTCNPRERPRIGTVGPPLPGVELRIAEDGELLCRGPMVMRGYRADPEQTAETIDADGWLHTGDIADDRPRRVRADRRPQEGADHQRRRQEHVACEHRGARSRARAR